MSIIEWLHHVSVTRFSLEDVPQRCPQLYIKRNVNQTTISLAITPQNAAQTLPHVSSSLWFKITY